MITENKELLKLFASVLRKRANDETETEKKVDRRMLYYLSRKDLIAIVKATHGDDIPGKPDLAMLEKEEIFALIKDELFVVSYMLNKWCQEGLLESTAAENGNED